MNDWITVGYEIFALQGWPGLKVETLAKRVGISKSSFYHHFADMTVFLELLMQTHLKQAAQVAAKERTARQIDPDLINILVEHKIDLLFSRQLRIHQDNPLFHQTLQKANEVMGREFIALWAAHSNVRLTNEQWNSLFSLALENFFLQINPDTLNHKWLAGYFGYLTKIVTSFR